MILYRYQLLVTVPTSSQLCIVPLLSSVSGYISTLHRSHFFKSIGRSPRSALKHAWLREWACTSENRSSMALLWLQPQLPCKGLLLKRNDLTGALLNQSWAQVLRKALTFGKVLDILRAWHKSSNRYRNNLLFLQRLEILCHGLRMATVSLNVRVSQTPLLELWSFSKQGIHICFASIEEEYGFAFGHPNLLFLRSDDNHIRKFSIEQTVNCLCFCRADGDYLIMSGQALFTCKISFV